MKSLHPWKATDDEILYLPEYIRVQPKLIYQLGWSRIMKPSFPSRRSAYVIGLFVALILFLLTGCQLKVPSPREQEALIERGTFATGTPAWVYRSSRGALTSPERDSGFIPGSFVAPAAVDEVNLPVEQQNSQPFRLLSEKEKASAVKAPSSAPISAIDRVLASCPGIDEASLTDAISTVELSTQVTKYEQLTKRCTTSADLWVWLGKDYKFQNRTADAARCFEKALVLNSQESEARELLSEVQQGK